MNAFLRIITVFSIFLFSINQTQAGVLYVTNTNDAGAGSFRAQVAAANHYDSIVFAVSGQVNILSPIDFGTHLIVFGATAKHNTIRFQSGNFQLNANLNVIFHNLRFTENATGDYRFTVSNGGDLEFYNCLFETFTDENNDGAVFSVHGPGASILADNCSFFDNTAVYNGGVLELFNSALAQFRNCTFFNNNAGFGGVFMLNTNVTIHLINNTFLNNSSVIENVTTNNNITLNNNIFSSSNPSGMLNGMANWNNLGGNVYSSNAGFLSSILSALGLTTIGDIYSLNQANIQLRATHVLDGYGLKWFPVVNAAGVGIDQGVSSVYSPTVDGRRAPRGLDGDINGSVIMDAGACEYTPYRVTTNLGAGDFASVFSSANSNFSGPIYIEFDCSPSGVHSVPGLTTANSGKWIIDGFTQFGSAVPGPSPSITAVTPGQYPNVISGSLTLLNFNVSGAGSSVSGLAFDNQFTTSIFIDNTNSINIFGNLFFSTNSDANIGVHVYGGNNHLIGGPFHYQRNVINGNIFSTGSAGIIIEQSSGTKVFGNFIGTSANGTSAVQNNDGVVIGFMGSDVKVGGAKLFQKNLISGNNNNGILITSGAGLYNKIESNFVGVSYDGTAQLGNAKGIVIDGNVNSIGNLNEQAGNIVSGNSVGIIINGNNNTIYGNIVGLNATATVKIPNVNSGIEITGSSNSIGNNYSDLAQRNIISGNGGRGFFIYGSGAFSNVISGNLIGPLGDELTIPSGNQNNGIEVFDGSNNNTIGGANLDNGNIISGNLNVGILFNSNVHSNTIMRNSIGMDADGVDILPNDIGIQLNNFCHSNSMYENLISKNNSGGIIINDGYNNLISGNVIGTDRTISTPLGNGNNGITLYNSPSNTIYYNNIHSNIGFGIDLFNSNSSVINANFIGGNANLSQPFAGSGNTNRGIFVDQSDSVQIGDGTFFNINYIKFNGGDGIGISGGSSLVQHSYNIISDNAGLGVDIDTDGVSVVPTNNEGAQAPIFSGASECSGVVSINGTVNGSPSTMYRLDFYKNTTPDPSGSGEAELYIERTYVITDGTGTTNFNHIFSAPVVAGDIITAIASDSINGSPIRNSSEFAINITVQPSPTITLNTTIDETCVGAMNGSIDITIIGGTAPFTYVWYNSSAVVVGSNEDLVGLGSDTYYLELTDNTGCIVLSSNYTISSPPPFSVSMTTTDITCFGFSDGTATVTETGGVGPYTYLWSPSSQTTQTATGLISTTHSVMVTDVNGCTAMTDGMVNEPAQIVIILSNTDPNCNGTATGSATASVSGGTPSYNYLWTPSNITAATATGLVSGTYTVQVTDINGCTNMDNITLIDPTAVTPPLVPNKDICNGESRTLSVSSPIGGITYRWYGTLANAIANTGQLGTGSTFTPTVIQAPVGQRTHFYVTATNGLGCVSSPTDVTLTHRTSLTQPSIISGPLNLCPSGTYVYSVSAPPPTITITDAVTSNFGMATEYFWTVPAGWTITSGQGTQNITVIASGIVSVGNITVLTRYNIPSSLATTCNSPIRTQMVNVRARPTANITPDPYTICEGTGGTINGNPTLPAPAGGFTPSIISHTWTGNTSILTATNIDNPTISPIAFSGVYTLSYVMTADFGSGVTCSSLADNATVNIVTPGNVGLVNQTNISCNGSNNGAITTNFTGGVGPFNYSWNSGAYSTQNISGLSTGTYQLTVIDGNGCSVTSPSYTITEPTALTFNQNFTPETCTGSNDGTLSLEITSGGTSPFNFEYFNDLNVSLGSDFSVAYNNVRLLTNLSSGDYYVVVTDQSSCVDTISYTILAPPVLTAFYTSPSIECAGTLINFIDASTSSPTPTSWQWDFGDFNTSNLQNPTHTYASAGVYTVTLTTYWGSCSESHTDNITINASPIVTNSNALTVCSNDLISVALSASISSNFTWAATYDVPLSGGSGTGTSNIFETLENLSLSPVNAAYSITPTSLLGCIGPVHIINVTVNPEPEYSGTNSFTICSGDALNINLVSPIPSTWNWDVNDNINVTGEAVFNQTSSTITDILSHSQSSPETVIYNIQPTSLLGCTRPYQTISVTVNPIPTTPVITTNSPVCEGTSLTLTTPTVIGASYSWSGPNGFASNLQNPTIVGISTAEAGTYSLVNTLAGCSSISGNSTVIVDVAPTTSNAGVNQNICSSSASTNFAANTPTIGTGLWSFVSGPGSPTIISPSNPNSLVVGLSTAGSYIFEWTISNASCAPSSSQVTITVLSNPATPNITNNSPICEGDNLLLSTPLIAGASYSWTGPNGFTSNLQNPTINTVTVSNAGTYSLDVTVNGCSSVNPGSTVATINQAPTVSNAGFDQDVCINVATATMSANTAIVGVGTWSFVSGPISPSFVDINSPITNINGMNNAGTYVFEWTISSVGCISSSDQVTIIVDNLPTAADAGLDTTACATIGTMTLFGNNPSFGTGTWSQISGPATTISSPSNNITNVTGLSSAGTYVYQWTIVNGTCSISTDQKVVTLNSGPTVSNAGSDQTICVSNPTISMNANFPTEGSGLWSQISGPNTASFTNTLAPTSLVNDLNVAGVYIFDWTISSVGCTSSSSQVTITVDEIPTFADAGLDTVACETLGSMTLFGNNPIVGTGVWSQISGTATTIASPTTNNTSVSGLNMAGTYIYEWTISNGVCVSSSDQKTITLSTGPTASNAGTGQSICISTASTTMAANTPINGIGSWFFISGPTTPSIITFTDPNTVINNLNAAGSYLFEWVISSSGCASSSSQITVNVDDVPTFSDAGLAQTICAGSDTVTMNANTPLVGTGSWMQITGGASIIDNTSSPSTIITGFVTPGTYVYDWVIGNGSCANSSDQVTITVEDAPTTSIAGANQDICVSAAATTLAANAPTIGTGTWSFVSGPSSPSFVSINSPTTSVNGLMMPGVYILEWTITNGSCAPSSSQVTITVNDNPTASAAGFDQTICSTTGTVTMNANAPFVGIGSWIQLSGPVTTIIDINSPTTAINGLTTAGVYDFQWDITNGSCTSSSDVVSITVNEGPSVTTTAPNNVCSSESTFNVLGTQNNATSVQWSILSGSGFLNSTTTNASVYTINTNDQGTTVILLFEGVASGCPNVSDTVYIVIDPIPNTPTTIDNLTQTVCEGTSVNLSASTTTNGANIFWFSNAGLTNQIGVGTNVSIGPIVSNGNAYVVSSLNGCVNNNPLVFNLNIVTNTVDAGEDIEVCAGATANLNGNATGNFYWMSEIGLSDTTILNPLVNPIVDTYYYLVSNNGGCSAMDSVLISISNDCGTIQVTNSFSPNGDGINETFTIDAATLYPENNVTILNRWGDVIYTAINYNNVTTAWDGTYQGQPVPEGTYFYLIEYTGSTEVSTGWVQVIR